MALQFFFVVERDRSSTSISVVDVQLGERLYIKKSALRALPKAGFQKQLADCLTFLAAAVSIPSEITLAGKTKLPLTSVRRELRNLELKREKPEDVTPAEIRWFEEDCIPLPIMMACKELGLHQWTEQGSIDYRYCAVCKVSEANAAQDTINLASVPLPMTPTRRRDRPLLLHHVPTGEPMRVLLHFSSLAEADEGIVKRLDILSQLGEREHVELYATDSLPHASASVPNILTRVTTDDREAEVKGARLSSDDDWVMIDRTARLAEYRVGLRHEVIEEGAAVAISLGYKQAHATVTQDSQLLRLRSRRHVPRNNLVTLEEILPIVGLHLRSLGSIPVVMEGSSTMSLYTHHFHEVNAAIRSRFLLPSMVAMRETKSLRRRSRAISALLGSVLGRLAAIGESTDRLGFHYYVPLGEEGTDDLLYHFEYFVLATQALFENLKALAQSRYSSIPGGPLSWKRFVSFLSSENPDLHDLCAQGKGAAILRVTAAIRHPLAHSHHWQGIWQSVSRRGDISKTLVQLGGEQARQMMASVLQLGGVPEHWGFDNWTPAEDVATIHPYPFAANLHGWSLWFVRDYLERLNLMAEADANEVSTHMNDLIGHDGWFNEQWHELISLFSLDVPTVTP